MRILMTGGTGFVGRHLLPVLKAHEVFALSREGHKADAARETGAAGSAVAAAHATWIDMDLSRPLEEDRLPRNVDAIIHLAQSGNLRDLPKSAPEVFRINVAAPAELLAWAEKSGVSRVVFASTGSVYEPFAGAMRETDAVSPTGYYGASKLAAEALALAYQPQFAVCQLRLFFPYGPLQRQNMMAHVIRAVARGDKVTLPKGSDGMVFVPTYVGDVARVFKRACEEGWRGVWNVASPHVASLSDVIETAGRLSGREPQIERIDAPPPPRIVPDLTKLRGCTDLDAFATLEQGIAQTLGRG